MFRVQGLGYHSGNLYYSLLISSFALPLANRKNVFFLLKKIEVANVPARRAARRTVTKIAGKK